MKAKFFLVFVCGLVLLGCQPVSPATITVIDGAQIISIQTDERIPNKILEQVGVEIEESDSLLVNGLPVVRDEPISISPSSVPITFQIRRTRQFTLITPDGAQNNFHSSAFSVGEALADSFFILEKTNILGTSMSSPITNGMTISLAAPRALTIRVDGQSLEIRSSARTIGEALAEAGIPLVGDDYSRPPESEPLPADGQINVIRVNETVMLAQKPIPFDSEFVASADVPLDQTQVISPGETGLTVQRIRIRYEDGEEISRITEDETVVRTPKNRTVGYGTKIEIKTATVNGVTIEYWRAVQMYATSYSPCRSGADRCYPGTSSGKSLAKGMVALRYSWYLSMGGQPLFVPGYGFATVEDVCGGCVGKPWIDLGYSDSDWEQWSSWVTVYFLTPVPQNIVYVLE